MIYNQTNIFQQQFYNKMSKVSPIKNQAPNLKEISSALKYNYNIPSIKKNQTSIKKNIYQRNQDQDLEKSYVYAFNDPKRNPQNKSYKIDNSRELLLISKHKEKIAENLQYKIQSILKHNSHLLNQNSSLVELLNQKANQINFLQRQLQQQANRQMESLNMIQMEKNRLLYEIQMKNKEKQLMYENLLDQISRLHNEKNNLQNEKNKQIAQLKDFLSKESLNQIQNLKRSQMNNIEFYQLQVKKLKQNIQSLHYEMESKQHQNRLVITKLQQENSRLISEIKHIKQINQLQAEQQKIHYQNIINTLTQQNRKSQEILTNNYENNIKKLKKQLSTKIIEIQRLSFKLHKNSEQNQMEYDFLKDGKEQLELKMMQFQMKTKDTFKQEKQKILGLTDAQIQTIQNTHKNFTQALRSQNFKLYQLSETKTKEIQKLHDQIEIIRQSHENQIKYDENLIKELKNKLNQIQTSTHEQLQLLKIKFAQLHSADINALKQLYQNQISVLSQQIQSQQNIIEENRKKLHTQLQQKTQIRKKFQIQLSKERNRIIELNLKIASENSKMKQNLSSLGTQMKMNSDTFLKDAQLKQKQVIVMQDGKKKLHELINSKDRQIQQLNELLNRRKEDYAQHLQEKQKQIQTLKDTLKNLDQSQKKENQFFQRQLKKKEYLIKANKQNYEKQISTLKTNTYQDLKSQIDNLYKQNLKHLKQIQHRQREKNSLLKDINLQKGITQKLKLQSNVLIQGQKQNGDNIKKQNQKSIRNFYEQTLNSKNTQIQELKHRLHEKEADLRELLLKYNVLEKKLVNILQGQQKLRDFENKIMNLGADNNLIKNMSELYKHKLR